jgi:hypothetical protein
MAINLTRYKADLDKQLQLGRSMFSDLQFMHLANTRKLDDEEKIEIAKVQGYFDRYYQQWYTEAHSVIKQLIPDRVAEFEHLYKGDARRREINVHNYCIQDWLNGLRAPKDIWKKALRRFCYRSNEIPDPNANS